MRDSTRPALWAVMLAVAVAPVARADVTPPIPAAQLPPPAPVPSPMASPGMQFLYGSGEAAANTRTVWHALEDYVRAHRLERKSVVLAPDSTPDNVHTMPCTRDQPLAAVFDVDETVLLNAGVEYDAAKGQPFSDILWQQWEVYGATRPIATPGAAAALAALRAMQVTVIFNTNRLAIHAEQTTAALKHAGLGPAVYFDDPARWREQTLYLADNQQYPAIKKDDRRARIASHYCVIAMAGDQLGDFTDLFNPQPVLAPQVRRRLTETAPVIADLWGRGWFTFPNPVYGTALTGTIDQVFPPAVRWPDEAAEGQ
jgi:predicted secreted acid phosphatase